MTMILGSYEFEWFPDRWTMPKTDKFTSHVRTWSSVAFFSFGNTVIGKEILLEWDWMSEEMFAALDAVVQSDEQVIWVPGDGDAYNVEIISPGLEGTYFETTAYNFAYRQNVKLHLLIMSVNNAYS
jgi:hypothetical protein